MTVMPTSVEFANSAVPIWIIGGQSWQNSR